MTFFDPDNQSHTGKLIPINGPPRSYLTLVDAPKAGKWKVVVGDGKRILGCKSFVVSKSRRRRKTAGPDGPAWNIRSNWNQRAENLYATFVERLFDYPIQEDKTWKNLQSLLQNPLGNILHNHFGQNEDAAIRMTPDCADLPYTLRAYFAWKMQLPFSFRDCVRARPGKPPRCIEGGNNLIPRIELAATSDVSAFTRLAAKLRSAVHSSSGRTHPTDSNTDYYPVALTKQSLTPGTLFNDPYGHLLTIVKWIPQKPGSYGILIGADAQPDGTIGRRRFWRGSFLFIPDIDSGGAGFKTYRASKYNRATQTLDRPKNRTLKRRKHKPFSDQQYQGTVDDFYDTMSGLINPLPLDPVAVQITLVDALMETVSRRKNSVNNGEEFMAQRKYAPIDMPDGARIFLTSGPWEDFSTPSRDWRLLISVDTAFGFPERVERSPSQFGLKPGTPETKQALASLRAKRDAALRAKKFSYTRSDGSTHELSLKDVVDRQKRLEMAYNPNDCVEIRWGAAPDTPEMATCKRHAPEAQRAKMTKYRHWFSTRRRPAN